ncbi:hypothetical protein Trydic_g3419 [Trypoxylus dichotomus]
MQVCNIPERELTYEEFMANYGKNHKVQYGLTIEIQLRQKIMCWAYCMTQDLGMERGIARLFHQKFRGSENFRYQNRKVDA